MPAFRTRFCLLLLLTAALLRADTSVSGTAMDASSKRPVEFVAVTLKKPDGTVVQSTVTDSRGRFTLEKVTPGSYAVAYNIVGADARTTPVFTVDVQRRALDLGPLALEAPATLRMEKVEVKAKQAAFLNSIDRKVYNVGKEIQSTTGSASDLLQNVPSVNVDIDGNVSLRGSDNVMILINGRTSTLMGKSRAEALQQLSADSIERIEVITNPSAKYTPAGHAELQFQYLLQHHRRVESRIWIQSVGHLLVGQVWGNVSTAAEYPRADQLQLRFRAADGPRVTAPHECRQLRGTA